MTELINALQGLLEKVRTTSDEYLEGVLEKEQLNVCAQLLEKALGPPAKPFDSAPNVEERLVPAIKKIGGIRKEQCLYLKALDAQRMGYAVLWPWESDPSQITLKVGTITS